MSAIFENSIPRKDDRGKVKKNNNHSHNLRIELEVIEKKRKRFLQSCESTFATQKKQDFEDFYEGLTKKEKRKFEKMNDEISKIESKGVKKNLQKSKEEALPEGTD